MAELREQLDAALARTLRARRTDVDHFAPGAGERVGALQTPLREAMLALLARALQRSRPEAASETAKARRSSSSCSSGASRS